MGQLNFLGTDPRTFLEKAFKSSNGLLDDKTSIAASLFR